MSAEQGSKKLGRRQWLQAAGKTTAAAAGVALFPPSIQRALAIPAARERGSLQDVQHVVILMQENRSFDHYFGTMSGVRGFGDRGVVPLASGQNVWSESDGKREILPFHLDTQTSTAMRVPGTPHTWSDAQQAWDQGRFGAWPRYKHFQSMGYYDTEDIPFQRALADAFTICDAHHCSIQTGTLANRIAFMTGTNYRPGMTQPAVTQTQAVIDNSNNRGELFGLYEWTTYPERLTAAGVSWRIYQDPQDNWGSLLAPWESFKAYQRAKPGEPLFENAMTHWSLESLQQHVTEDTLPQVSWIIPTPVWSEHPAESSPLQGASYTQQVLDILVSNPEVWSRTVFIVTFDENDGFFDHAPPPAPPSIDSEGRRFGMTTLGRELDGEYFTNDIAGVVATRPYGMGPRVPMYVVSPWSRGGWVCSQVFDHTSVIRFLEARFGVREPNISAFRRAVSGDLTSCFDFDNPNAEAFPELPDMSYATGETLVINGLPAVKLPDTPSMPAQDPGLRYSRALPYRLAVHTDSDPVNRLLQLTYDNAGTAGAVFHVYDRLHLERWPYRYVVEAGKSLVSPWATLENDGRYDLQVIGPNGFVRRIAGQLAEQEVASARPELRLDIIDANEGSLQLQAWNAGDVACEIKSSPNAYRSDAPFSLTLEPGAMPSSQSWSIRASGLWYDFTVTCPMLPGWSRQFAGRVENGQHGTSDPALCMDGQLYSRATRPRQRRASRAWLSK
jgi:phospholipase C